MLEVDYISLEDIEQIINNANSWNSSLKTTAENFLVKTTKPKVLGEDYYLHTLEPFPHPDYPLIGLEWEVQLSLPSHGTYPVICYVTSKNKPQLFFVDRKDEETYFDTFTRYPRLHSFVLGIPYDLMEKYCMFIDMGNIEISTYPCGKSDFKNAVKEAEGRLFSLIEELAKEVGPIGVLLPIPEHLLHNNPLSAHLRPTKHINISSKKISKYVIVNNVSYDGLYHSCKIDYKIGFYGVRCHIFLPYNFKNYDDLFVIFEDNTPLTTPLDSYNFDEISRLENYYLEDYLKPQIEKAALRSLAKEGQMKDPILVGYCKHEKFFRVNGLV